MDSQPRDLRFGRALVDRTISAKLWIKAIGASKHEVPLYLQAISTRVGVVLLALAIIYLRTPTTFTNPQFWGEDITWFADARYTGVSALITPVAGYLLTIERLVALLTSPFSPAFAPTIYNYADLLLTLLVVWIITSPRLDMPFRPLLAVAVVIVPMGREVLGTLTNIQWILPLGAFALLFMSASQSRSVLVAESIFLGLTAVSGPFSIFLAPMFLWRSVCTLSATERRRLTILSSVVCLGAVIQIAVIVSNREALTNVVGPSTFSWTLWINMPVSLIMTSFRILPRFFTGSGGAILGLIVLAAAAALASQRPYRAQKIFILMFSLLIAFSGMYKFRGMLGAPGGIGSRYFYPGSVMLLWFVCCLSNQRFARPLLAGVVGFAELSLLPAITQTPQITVDLQWPAWMNYASSGLPLTVPTLPQGWYLDLPAVPNGPLSRFGPWIGQRITKVAGEIDRSACSGAMAVAPLGKAIHLERANGYQHGGVIYSANGVAQDASGNQPVKLTTLVNGAKEVVGFGLPGFKLPEGTPWEQSPFGWKALLSVAAETELHAYGVMEDGQRVCPLESVSEASLGSETLVSALPINGQILMQRFKPSHRLLGLSVQFVTWGKTPTPYAVSWRIIGRSNSGQLQELGVGKLGAASITDWRRISLPTSNVPKDLPNRIEVYFAADDPPLVTAPIGLPIFQRAPGNDDPAIEIGGVSPLNAAQLNLRIYYRE
jgi:hypothetical protein